MTTLAARRPTYGEALALALWRVAYLGEKQVIRCLPISDPDPRGRFVVRPYDGLAERRTREYRALRNKGYTKPGALQHLYWGGRG